MARPDHSAFKPSLQELWKGQICPLSPSPPAIEPLSPSSATLLTPFESLFAQYSAPSTGRRQRKKVSRARKPSTKSTASNNSRHARKASGSIDDLAQAALAIGAVGLPPVYGHDSNQWQGGPRQQSTAVQPRWPMPSIQTHDHSGRPSKRARSEAELFASTQAQHVIGDFTRPTSSYLPTGKRMSESDTKQLADAALLLGFAAHAPVKHPRSIAGPSVDVELPDRPIKDRYSNGRNYEPPHERRGPQSTGAEAHKASATEFARALSNAVMPDMEVHTFSNESLITQITPFVTPGVSDDATPSFNAPLRATQPLVHDPAPEVISNQDHRGDTTVDDIQSTMTRSEIDDEETLSIAGEKPKTRRGWPKGKARGPRKSTLASTKSRSSANKKPRKSKMNKEDDVLQPRRKSASDIYDLQAETSISTATRSASVPPRFRFHTFKLKSTAGRKAYPKFTKDTVCTSCMVSRESTHGETDQWISCNACKKWFHSDCAGFKNDRDVKDVDKFHCNSCAEQHGPTTFVRKSTRAHAAVDYAGLNQGVLKTSDDCNEHHYIAPIKDETFTFDAETFPRMRPELVTRDYFERSACFNEPILIPAEFNPKPKQRSDSPEHLPPAEVDVLEDFEYETVPDDGQDKLDMIIPQDLTIRKVSELVGPDYPLEVIDVKDQNIEGGKWNLGKWADYYEADGGKAIRNVISLEVAHTKLGRLLRRPKIVRQIDLQDSVWPEDEDKKSVAFYCLMSVADSYTDFHIDFGGSSVYYHILRGSKTFFFIPPKPKHLKAYEDWNNSHQQNFTFLPDITKECYRVDLFEGDTMLIPSGWIHAVWTPSNSLVIGGNFLTHMHYSMQLRVVDVERANKVGQKFRYPKFQKVMWYALLKYLRDDPLPETVREDFYRGHQFRREHPVWMEFERSSPEERGSASYNARYYSQQELDGLTDLVAYIFRTVMIHHDRIEGITTETRKNVMASIPKNQGDPLVLAKAFALWVAWKHGNEDPPAWAHPDACLPEKEGVDTKKLSAKALRQLQRQEAFEAFRVAPERQSIRQKQIQEKEEKDVSATSSTAPEQGISDQPHAADQQPQANDDSPKKPACDVCRKRRIRCKHKTDSPSARQFHSVVIHKMDVAPPSALMSAESSSQSNGQWAVQAEQTPESIVAPPASNHYAATTPMVSLQLSPQNIFDGSAKRGRSKACLDCRRSKRRCVHDENGRVDPQKEKMLPIPRGSVPKKRKGSSEGSSDPKKAKVESMQHDFAITDLCAMQPPGAHPLDFALDPQLTGIDANFLADNAAPTGLFDIPQSHWAQADPSYHAAQDDHRAASGNELTSQPPNLHVPLKIEPQAEDIEVVDPDLDTAAVASTDSTDVCGAGIHAQARPVHPPITNHALDATRYVAGAEKSVINHEAATAGPPMLHSTISAGFEKARSDTDRSTEHLSDQTPSANDPPSLSSASSPLSATGDGWPEALATPIQQSFEPFVRQSQRQSRPVDRFVSHNFDVLKGTPDQTKAMSAPASRARKTSSVTPGPVATPRADSASMRRSKTPKKSVEKPDSMTGIEVGLEMSEDERYARMLAGESFGLRTRRSAGT